MLLMLVLWEVSLKNNIDMFKVFEKNNKKCFLWPFNFWPKICLSNTVLWSTEFDKTFSKWSYILLHWSQKLHWNFTQLSRHEPKTTYLVLKKCPKSHISWPSVLQQWKRRETKIYLICPVNIVPLALWVEEFVQPTCNTIRVLKKNSCSGFFCETKSEISAGWAL